MARISISVRRTKQMMYVPLAVLGYALRCAGVLEPLEQLTLPMKTIDHTPVEKLMEGLVLILAGGRATNQVNQLLRPNAGLARAWGQVQFAEQSTLARTLDGLADGAITQLRQAFNAITQAQAHSCRHDFRSGLLWLDADLTGLPSSRRAEGATKGFFAGKKTAAVGNWPG
jgi:hypothetical protein